MTDIKELGYFGDSGVLVYNTAFLDVSKFTNFQIIAFNNSDYQYTLNWSSDGINTDVMQVENGTGGTAVTAAHVVKAKYLRITYTATSTPTNWRNQTLFRKAPEGLATLKNAGAGAELYKLQERAVRSVKSSDATISVTQDSNEIDVTASFNSITLSSATGATGSTYSIVAGQTGPNLTTKALTAGDGITLTDSTTNVTISSSGGTSSYAILAYSSSDTEFSSIMDQTLKGTDGWLAFNMSKNLTFTGVSDFVQSGDTYGLTYNGSTKSFFLDWQIASRAHTNYGPKFRLLINGGVQAEMNFIRASYEYSNRIPQIVTLNNGDVITQEISIYAPSFPSSNNTISLYSYTLILRSV
jgi:hypothetical protein